MKVRSLAIAAFVGAMVALPSLAQAVPARATGSVNLRTGPGVNYARITVVPAGARIQVYRCTSWCSVNYRGYRGWVSASYVSRVGPRYRAPVYRPAPPPYYHYPQPAPYGYYRPYRPYRPYYGPGFFSFGFGFRG